MASNQERLVPSCFAHPMQVTDIQRRLDGSRLELSANVIGMPGRGGPQRAWIRVPADAAPSEDPLSDGAAWLAAMLPAAVVLGQPLEIDAPVPSRLQAGAGKIMGVWKGWNRQLQPVPVRAAATVADGRRPEGVASFFSGGVDSFYTVLRRLHDPRLKAPSDLILVHGFDYPADGPLRAEVAERIGRVAEGLGVGLIEVETNLRRLNDRLVPWGGLQHGSLMAAIGLSLSERFGRILIPATFTYDTFRPWGSHPFTDPLWSTEATGFIHDGPEMTRAEKIAAQVARSDLALANLRVCFTNTAGSYNCGRCGKCQRTMIGLRLAGALDLATAFLGEPDPALLDRVDTTDPAAAVQTRWVLEALQQQGLDPDVQAALKRSLRPRPRFAARTGWRWASPRLRIARNRRLPRARLPG